MRLFLYPIAGLILACFCTISIQAQGIVDVETGMVFTGYNNVRIPGNQGTLVSLKDDLSPKPGIFYRITACYTVRQRHTFSLLYAPLETRSTGNVVTDVLFQEVVFPANTPLEGSYRFNSYRLTYRYDLVQNPRLEFGLGITGKVRDARISLTSAGHTAEKINVGFVPLIHFRLLWKKDDQYGLLLYGDALAAPQGRAEDVMIAATYTLSDRIEIRAGYRILEGGADNNEVYTFSLFNYASIGITYTFYKPSNGLK